jgi:hypothetical protein
LYCCARSLVDCACTPCLDRKIMAASLASRYVRGRTVMTTSAAMSVTGNVADATDVAGAADVADGLPPCPAFDACTSSPSTFAALIALVEGSDFSSQLEQSEPSISASASFMSANVCELSRAVRVAFRDNRACFLQPGALSSACGSSLGRFIPLMLCWSRPCRVLASVLTMMVMISCKLNVEHLFEWPRDPVCDPSAEVCYRGFEKT